MQKKLGIVAECIIGKSGLETLEQIREHGFTTFFSSERNTSVPYVTSLKEKAVALGLEYAFIHGPFLGINEMWTSQSQPPIFEKMKQAIDAASAAKVEAVVVHVSSGFTPPQIDALGLSRFDAWVEYAAKKGVVLAFENLRKLGNFAYIMDRYEQNENVKFCYDCGHEHCFTINVPFLDFYAEKLAYTHLHDNFGRDNARRDGGDLHLLPFDGNIDYTRVMQGLKNARYIGALTLEVNSAAYPQYTEDEFLAQAFARAKRLSSL